MSNKAFVAAPYSMVVGTLFLLVCWVRHINGEFRAAHHFGFEAAA